METDQSMVSTRDASRQNRIGSSGRSLQEIEAYMRRGRRLHAEFTAALVRTSGLMLKTGCLRIATRLAKAGKRIRGAGELLYDRFFKSGKSSVICKCEQR